MTLLGLTMCALEPFRPVVRQLGNVSWLHEPGGLLRSSFARPRFPASRTVAYAVISDGREHRIDQWRAILWSGSFNLWSEGSQCLLGSFETYLARVNVVLVGGNGHDRAE